MSSNFRLFIHFHYQQLVIIWIIQLWYKHCNNYFIYCLLWLRIFVSMMKNSIICLDAAKCMNTCTYMATCMHTTYFVVSMISPLQQLQIFVYSVGHLTFTTYVKHVCIQLHKLMFLYLFINRVQKKIILKFKRRNLSKLLVLQLTAVTCQQKL